MTYIANGTQTDFMFSFDYLRKTFVKVTLDGEHLEYLTDYQITGEQIQLAVAPASNVIIEIYRETPTERLVAWEDASVLRAKDLTVFEVQVLHITEETADKVQESGLALDADDVWDARYKRIKNLQDPQFTGDAVTLKYLQSEQGGITANKLAAEEAARIATEKAQVATDKAQVALTKATEAEASATQAATSASASISASGTATQAKNTAVAAKGSAEEFRDEAEEFAKRAEDAAKISLPSIEGQAGNALVVASGEESLKWVPMNRFINTVGDIRFPAMTVKQGEVKLNGALLLRASYPALWAWAQSNNLVATEAGWAGNWGGCFGEGDGLTTFRLPDLRGQFLRVLDDGRGLDDFNGRKIGQSQGDAIRNFIARFGFAKGVESPWASDALSLTHNGNVTYAGHSGPTINSNLTFELNPSKVVPTASENRPRNTAYFACIRFE